MKFLYDSGLNRYEIIQLLREQFANYYEHIPLEVSDEVLNSESFVSWKQYVRECILKQVHKKYHGKSWFDDIIKIMKEASPTYVMDMMIRKVEEVQKSSAEDLSDDDFEFFIGCMFTYMGEVDDHVFKIFLNRYLQSFPVAIRKRVRSYLVKGKNNG